MGNKGSKTEKRKSKESKSPRVSKKKKKKSKSLPPKNDDGIGSLINTKTLSVTLSCPETLAEKSDESRIDTPSVIITSTNKMTKRPSPMTKNSSSSARRSRKKRGNRLSSSSKSSTRSLEPIDPNNGSLPAQKASRNSEIIRIAKLSPTECRFSESDEAPLEPLASLPDIYLAASPDAKFDWGETLVKPDDGSSGHQDSVVDHLGSWHSSSAVSIKGGSTCSIVGVLGTSAEVVENYSIEVIPVGTVDSMAGSKEWNNGAYLGSGSFANEEFDSAFMHSEGTVLDASLDFSPSKAGDNADTPKKSDMDRRNSSGAKVYSLSDVNIVISDSEPKHKNQSDSDINIVFTDTEPKPTIQSTHSSKITMENDIFSATASDYEDVGSVRTSNPVVVMERPNYSKASMEMFKFDKLSVMSNDMAPGVLSDVSADENSGFYRVATESVGNRGPESVSVDHPLIKIKKEEVFSGFSVEKSKGHSMLSTENTEEDSPINRSCVSTIFKDPLSYSQTTTAIESPRKKSLQDSHLSTPTKHPIAGDEKPPLRTVESTVSMNLDLFRLYSKESQQSEAGMEHSVLMDNKAVFDEQAQDESTFRIVISEPVVTVERTSAYSRDRNKYNSDSNFLEAFDREKPFRDLRNRADRDESIGSWYPDLS